MPYNMGWYIENEILYTHYSGVVTVDEVRECLTLGKNMIENSPQPLVHSITDIGDVTEPLKPQKSLEVVREVGIHERTGWNIILREKSILLKIGIAFGTSVFSMRTRTFNTIDEAEKFLSEKDTTINWDKADKSILAIES